jgi:ABC-type multidrug transport system ATPase subunit
VISELVSSNLTNASNPADDAVFNTASVVFLEQVSKHFGRFAALRGVTATFAPARLHVILGDNGAGKSTLMRVIAGLTPATRGAVSIFGSNNLRAVCDRVGYMAHAPLLYDELDGMENMLYFAGLYGITDPLVSEAAISQVGLDPKLKRRVGQYSQGMRQRLSLARAVVHDPDLLLLDEPFSNVDIISARQMVKLLGIMRDAGKTIFVITHQPSLLADVADEYIWMAQGQILARTATLQENPSGHFPVEVA